MDDKRSFETMIEAIDALRAQGYIYRFRRLTDSLECSALNRCYNPGEFEVDYIIYFEGTSQAESHAVIYAIACADTVKGLLASCSNVYVINSDDIYWQLSQN